MTIYEDAKAGGLTAQQREYYHKKASDFIFSVLNDPRPDYEIDLHGQLEPEAKRALEWRIACLQPPSGDPEPYLLVVIVGQGIHSPGGRSVLGPMVWEFCTARGLPIRPAQYPGRLEVLLGGKDFSSLREPIRPGKQKAPPPLDQVVEAAAPPPTYNFWRPEAAEPNTNLRGLQMSAQVAPEAGGLNGGDSSTKRKTLDRGCQPVDKKQKVTQESLKAPTADGEAIKTGTTERAKTELLDNRNCQPRDNETQQLVDEPERATTNGRVTATTFTPKAQADTSPLILSRQSRPSSTSAYPLLPEITPDKYRSIPWWELWQGAM